VRVNGSFDWAIVLDVGVGLGVLLMGVGLFVVCLRLAEILKAATHTLDTLDRQLTMLAPPMIETLSHVGGIAGTADATLARLTAAVDAVEGLAGGTAQNLGAVAAALSGRLRRFVRGAPVDVDV
jgi:hypothetical protein